MDIASIIYTLTTWIFPLLLTIVLHEVAHGVVAYQLGDKTAKRAGRLTLNPLDHVDLYGTIIIPIFLLVIHAPILFGWAKPVPVNFNALNRPKRDMGIVALAGPVANFVLAILFALVGRLLLMILPTDAPLTLWVIDNMRNGISLSLVIGIFNLIPILPLDGGRIVASLLPEPYSQKYQESERYGFMILLGLLFFFPLIGINPIQWFIGTLYPYFARMVNIFL